MGTDIYMEWDNKSKEDKDKQMTGFSIKDGEVGYMRASIGMTRENSFLRLIFNEKDYWENSEKKPYDFKKHYEMLGIIGVKYLLSAIKGEDIEINSKSYKSQQEQAKKVLALFSKLGGDVHMKTNNGGIEEFRFAVMWLNSLFAFFEFGIELQKEGKNPYPYISW